MWDIYFFTINLPVIFYCTVLYTTGTGIGCGINIFLLPVSINSGNITLYYQYEGIEYRYNGHCFPKEHIVRVWREEQRTFLSFPSCQSVSSSTDRPKAILRDTGITCGVP
jgi:hypothetical protein